MFQLAPLLPLRVEGRGSCGLGAEWVAGWVARVSRKGESQGRVARAGRQGGPLATLPGTYTQTNRQTDRQTENRDPP